MSEEKNTIEENKEDLNKDKSNDNKAEEEKKISPEKKIVELEDKLTRSFAELENQRRRFEKEKDEAFDLKVLPVSFGLLRLKSLVEKTFTFLGNKLVISLNFPRLLVPINILEIFLFFI